MIAFTILIPAYIACLVPYAMVGGDAHYIPNGELFNTSFWSKAAVRKATDLHLAFLHPEPIHAVITMQVDLFAKISLPVLTTLTAQKPRTQMILVTLIGLIMWVNSIIHAPYVERKFCVFVQNLKLFTLVAFLSGCFTVFLQDKASHTPMIMLLGGGSMVFLACAFEIGYLKARRPRVISLVSTEDLDEQQQPIDQEEGPDPKTYSRYSCACY